MRGDPAATGHSAARWSWFGGDAWTAVRQNYGLINLEFWLRKYLGEDVARFIEQNVHPLDIVFRLARDYGIVLLNGGGFHAPDWSVRVSFANLEDDVYDDIGRAIRTIAQDYVHAYHAAQQAGSTPAVPEPAWPKESMQ